jgi:hypothetical protein
MPAETFVQIWKCIARPNICAPRLRETPIPLGASGGHDNVVQYKNEKFKPTISKKSVPSQREKF